MSLDLQWHHGRGNKTSSATSSDAPPPVTAGLFIPDERERIFREMAPWALQQEQAPTREETWSAFIDRVRENLHVLLAMSPVGDTFRTRSKP